MPGYSCSRMYICEQCSIVLFVKMYGETEKLRSLGRVLHLNKLKLGQKGRGAGF